MSPKSHWPVTGKAILYFLIAAIPEGIKYFTTLDDTAGSTITKWGLIVMLLTAVYQGLLVLRSFYDGSAQRRSDAANGSAPTVTIQTNTK